MKPRQRTPAQLRREITDLQYQASHLRRQRDEAAVQLLNAERQRKAIFRMLAAMADLLAAAATPAAAADDDEVPF
ncbi:MAG: hypothetical protein QHC65_04100 [Sphingomonas sp.]|nr:hypothetical protein [Sphingomonas sp.]MDX3883580.1 hypothetical protein [Sphingomonas sp.]